MYCNCFSSDIPEFLSGVHSFITSDIDGIGQHDKQSIQILGGDILYYE